MNTLPLTAYAASLGMIVDELCATQEGARTAVQVAEAALIAAEEERSRALERDIKPETAKIIMTLMEDRRADVEIARKAFNKFSLQKWVPPVTTNESIEAEDAQVTYE